MSAIIAAERLSKVYGDVKAVDCVDLDVRPGTVLGLIGPNGAGKTTLLRTLLGLADFDGQLQVLGLNPQKDRSKLLEEVCFIADTAVLPRWMKVGQLLDYVAGVHPRFDRRHAERFLQGTKVHSKHCIKELSKGMTVQLHLALVMAIDARLLILDEPTLGLDILFRKRFFDQLLNDYFDDERTIIISTHQVEEVQNILTEVMFMNAGRKVLHSSMADLENDYVELHAVGAAVEQARQIQHIGQRSILGGQAFIYEQVDRARLVGLGDARTPSISDLFVAKVGGYEEPQHV